jgi:mono/diheme cytochrome c family protein
VLVALFSGCEGQSPSSQGAQLRRGEAVFTRSCAECHTLTGRDSSAAGGDLAIARLGVRDLASFARVMPVRLSRAEVNAVAAYIHAFASRPSGR